MTKDVEKIYDYVKQMEDRFYGYLQGDGSFCDQINSAQATAFQRVRYFIEVMEEETND